MPTKLKLSDIKIDGGTQPRCQINNDTVSEYAEAIKAGTKLPPITVFFDGSNHWLGDGFHRLFAHQEAGLDEIECNVERGLLRAAILHSVGANHSHGLRRTNADKRRAVETLLKDKEWSKWSDREVAEKCHVTHPFVAEVKRSLSGNVSRCADDKPETRKVERNGKTYEMKTEKISAANQKRAEQKPEAKPEQQPEEEPSKELPVLDEVNQVIPEHLQEVFQARAEFRAMLQVIKGQKSAFEMIGQTKAGVHLVGNSAEFEVARKTLWGIVSETMPHAVCGKCHGDKGKSKGCDACKGRGWLPSRHFKNLTPEFKPGGKHAPATVSAAGC